MEKVVFLDRDGVINIDINYLDSPDKLVLIDGTKEALRIIKDKGYKIYVVTNQSGIGRGYFTEETLTEIHTRLNEMVDNMIDHFFYCPHLPSQDCFCRKPSLGMVIQELNGIDLDNSYLVGDKAIDIQMGKNLGVKTVTVKTGYGEESNADYEFANLYEFVRNVL